MRMPTKEIQIGSLKIGGENPIAIQSMCNTITSDIRATVNQIHTLEDAGCDIIRVAIPDEAAAEAIGEIRKKIHIPLVADIHFSPDLAVQSIKNGVDKIRINPGNIGGPENLRKVVTAAKERNVPIRVGVNSGSLEKALIEKYGGHVTPEGLVESALDKCRMIEEMDYDRLVISIKSSDVPMCVSAHELIRDRTQYPLHIGITEAGTPWAGNIKSSIGLGILLNEGIGDTIRVSLTGDPLQEVLSAKRILQTLGLRNEGIEVVSCPTCGRTGIDLVKLANAVTELTAAKKYQNLKLKVACMGCVVNGPGEAREADLAICGGKNEGLIIKKGEILKKVPESELLNAFIEELDKYIK